MRGCRARGFAARRHRALTGACSRVQVLQGAADDAPELQVQDDVQADAAGVPANVSCVTAALHTPLAPGKGATLQTYAAHTKLLTPKPAEVRQDDVQRVVYAGNLFMLSPYRVESQTLKARPERAPRRERPGVGGGRPRRHARARRSSCSARTWRPSPSCRRAASRARA